MTTTPSSILLHEQSRDVTSWASAAGAAVVAAVRAATGAAAAGAGACETHGMA